MQTKNTQIKSKALLLLFLGSLLLVSCGKKDVHRLSSPDEQIRMEFTLKEGMPHYSVRYKDSTIIKPSKLGLRLKNAIDTGAFQIDKVSRNSKDETWDPLYGEQSTIRDHYNEMALRLSNGSAPRHTLDVIFRCYDAGLAFRYKLSGGDSPGSITIEGEDTEFRFGGDHTLWSAVRPQQEYTKKSIREMGSDVCRPLPLKVDDSTYVAITEAALVDYARGKLARSQDHPLGIVPELSSEVQSSLPLTTPWRVVMFAHSPGELLENNELLLNLNEPCQLDNTSWIRPGKVIREVTLTTQGARACIDFADKHNMQFIEFDTGWYGSEFDTSANPMTVASGRVKKYPWGDVYINVDLDMPEIIKYGREHDVGVILYVNHVALENYPLDEVFATYKEWGIAGVKFGFVHVGSQKWTSWLHDAVRKAAKHQLMVNIHDMYRPTGYSRTYPNLITQEGIGGDEVTPPTRQSLITLFSRMIAGAADNTICYFDSRVDENWSHAHQLAKAVCFYSPLQCIYWYDKPKASPRQGRGPGGGENILEEVPELEFFDHVPTVWDETKVIHGSIGNYAVTARRSGENWFVGGMNSRQARSFELPLGFLSEGQTYMAHIYFDDPSVDTRTQVGIERRKVDAGTVLDMDMLANGGQAIRIVPAATGE